MSTPINQVQPSSGGDDDIVQEILNQMDKEAQEVDQEYNQQQDNYNDQQFGMDPQQDLPQNVPYQAQQMAQQYEQQPPHQQQQMNYGHQEQMYYEPQGQITQENLTWVQKITHFVMRYGKTAILASAVIFVMCLPVVGKTIVRYIPKFSNQYGGLNTWGLLLRALLSGILISSVNIIL